MEGGRGTDLAGGAMKPSATAIDIANRVTDPETRAGQNLRDRLVTLDGTNPNHVASDPPDPIDMVNLFDKTLCEKA
jgi:hypothetical protein